MPLRMSLPGQTLRTHSTSFQLSVGSNWLAVHCASDVTFSMPFTWPARLPKVLRLPLRIESAQAGLVAMALAEHLQVDREHQRAALGGGGALDQRLDEAAVLHHVELEPERLAGGLRHVLDRADRHGGERERNAGRLRRATRQDLAVAVLHA